MSDTLAYLRDLEFSARADAGHSACPDCAARQPLDPANPREWEAHGPDCRMAAAIADVTPKKKG